MNALTLFNSTTSIKDARRLFFDKNIKSVNSDDRIIFYPKDRSSRTNYDDSVVRECNGLIIDLEEKRLVVIPPPLLLHTFKYKIVNDFITQNLYTIYEIKDGTRISMYYFRNSWRISSARGYDVTDLKWNGSLTYKEIFDSLLLELNIPVDDFYDSLNKQCCYNWGFNHRDYHPFSDKNCIWYIGSFNTHTSEIVDSYPYRDIIPGQEIIPHTDGKTYIDASDLRVECEQAFKNFFKTKTKLFGYILRSNNPEITGKI